MTTPPEVKRLTIKIPVFVSELIETKNEIINFVTYQNMVDGVKKKIDAHNASLNPIKISRRNKVSEKAVERITPTEVEVLGRKSLLIKYTSYNTNYNDGFFEKGSKIGLTKDAKFGSDNNFILLCPYIKNGDFTTTSYWIILIYEDPNKESIDIISTAKALLNKVLKIRVKNIKLNSAIKAIKNAEVIQNAIIRITTVDTDPDNDRVLFKTHLVGNTTKIIQENIYKNLPPEDAISLIEPENSAASFYYKAVKKIFLSEKKEIKITQISNEETNNSLKQIFEEIYNTESLITEDELENCLYNDIFVLSKLEPVLIEYLGQIHEK